MTAIQDHMTDLATLPEAHALAEAADNAYFRFRPRPDNIALFDEQYSFVCDRLRGIAFAIGGNASGTTECAMHKIARLVLADIPPPRFDTPFWIIGTKYDKVIKSCWKEKLYGHGHIPGCEIDWTRVQWYSQKAALPSSVPLLPWPTSRGGHPKKNWVLEFKSYLEGRDQMQAESIGGFCFSEQFPWELLVEVLRGCRETYYPGSMICEFTPVDPALSVELETLIDEDRMPDTWKVYRMNTEENVKAGGLSGGAEWLDEFRASISDEMLETRMTGAFASYEGTIYQSFDQRVHCTPKGRPVPIPPNCWHRRAIDWGSGPEHPFVCLWACRDGMGRWYVYDEYHSGSQTLTAMDHLEEVVSRHHWPPNSAWHGNTWADPSRPDMMRIFGQRIGITGARNNVYPGIEQVRVALKSDANGQPGLLINRDNCPNLTRQMRTYRWLKPAMNSINPKAPRPEPLKKDDDEVDALRYLIFSEHHSKGVGVLGRRVQRAVPKHVGFRRTH